MALKSLHYKNQIFDISYEIQNPHKEVDFVILHGWGSNKGLMKNAFFPYMKEFRHIYIDLPGFGNSTAPIALNTDDVANIIELLLTELHVQKDIILGHSFGGKVALLLDPSLLVLVASAGIYEEKSLQIKAKIALFKCFKFLGLSKLRSLLVAEDAKDLSEVMYETFKTVVNEDFSFQFSAFEHRALLFWGEDDTATPLRSAKKMVSLIPNASLKVYSGDHYFFLHHTQDIAQTIEKDFLQLKES